VDTETPRPEKLVVDFDTTVNSSPTDISGNGNHGVFYGTASYSAADKAFDTPNATGILVRGSSLGSGAQPLTLCAWAKGTGAWNATANDCIIGVGPNSSSGNTSFQLCVNTDAITLDMASASNFLEFPTTITNGRWYFIAMTYTGGDAFTNTRVYVDGVEIAKPVSWTNGSSASLALPSNPDIGIGTRAGNGSANSPAGYLGGMVSNPKIYNVALEASEVQKLYRLGRTGRSMVISDTAVGIGKVPEAQLDVRGNLNVDGVITSNIPAFSAYEYDGYTATATGYVTLGNTFVNKGGCYDTSNGTFTAPISGTYRFTVDATLRSPGGTGGTGGTGVTTITLYINNANWNPTSTGRPLIYQVIDPGTHHQHVSGSLVWNLNAGDTARIYMPNLQSDSDINWGTGYGRFMGYLIS
jgi:hypothetical protein